MKCGKLRQFLSSLWVLPFWLAVSACYAENGMDNITLYFSAHIEPLKAGDNVVHANFKVHGVMVSASGEGPFHHATVVCQGGLLAIKGQYDYDGELCVIQTSSGEQIFGRWSSTGQLGQSGRTKMRLIGGTGGWSGVTGEGESQRVVLRGPASGVSSGYEKGSIRWSRP